MPLFGSTRARGFFPSPDAVAAKPPEPSPQPTRRRGLFGRMAGNDGDRSTPNLWDWLVLGPTAPDILQQRQQRADAFNMQTDAYNMQVQRRKQEEALAQQQQAELEAAIATLPPEQQVYARLNPEAFAQSLFRRQDRFGDLESIGGRLGQRNLETNEYSWAPQVRAGAGGARGYYPDDGYDYEE